MKIFTLLALIMTLSSCSFSDSNKEEVAVQHDDLEFAVDTIADQPMNQEFEVPVQEEVAFQEEVAVANPEEPLFADFKQPDQKIEDNTTEAPAKIYIDPIQANGSMEKYKVQKGETLMMIAFKIYGDYRKWKEIKDWNKDVMKIAEGTELSYVAPEQKFGWSPDGLPYLIRTGDTLGTVSMDKYGTTKKWKSIYENNRPLIKNPNLIFAGFTIYYQPERGLASEPK